MGGRGVWLKCRFCFSSSRWDRHSAFWLAPGQCQCCWSADHTEQWGPRPWREPTARCRMTDTVVMTCCPGSRWSPDCCPLPCEQTAKLPEFVFLFLLRIFNYYLQCPKEKPFFLRPRSTVCPWEHESPQGGDWGPSPLSGWPRASVDRVATCVLHSGGSPGCGNIPSAAPGTLVSCFVCGEERSW